MNQRQINSAAVGLPIFVVSNSDDKTGTAGQAGLLTLSVGKAGAALAPLNLATAQLTLFDQGRGHYWLAGTGLPTLFDTVGVLDVSVSGPNTDDADFKFEVVKHDPFDLVGSLLKDAAAGNQGTGGSLGLLVKVLLSMIAQGAENAWDAASYANMPAGAGGGGGTAFDPTAIDVRPGVNMVAALDKILALSGAGITSGATGQPEVQTVHVRNWNDTADIATITFDAAGNRTGFTLP